MEVLEDFENADTISIDTLALEKIILEERSTEISKLKALSDKVCNIHTNVLYHRNMKTKIGVVCYEAWKTLVKKVGGSQNGWRDLGHCLNISRSDLDYIMNSVKDDPVDVVLKVYMQNEKATLDKIVNAFVTLNRYDILKTIEDPFLNLAQCFNKDDSGYQSKSNGSKEIISLTKNLPNDLPPALNKNFVIKDKDPNKPNVPKPKPQSQAADKENRNDNPILFLTFTEDGLQTAENIQDYVENWTEIDVTVITLSDKKREVYQNPEKFIREYFEKADFVVPIITSGYLNELRSCNTNGPNATDNLDHKYVNFIYTLLSNHYIHATGCLNKKVRSVLPQKIDVDVFQYISMYPALMPWTHESKFNEQFQAFLKLERS